MTVYYLKYWIKKNVMYIIFLISVSAGTIAYIKWGQRIIGDQFFLSIVNDDNTELKQWLLIFRKRAIEIFVLIALAYTVAVKPVFLMLMSYAGIMIGVFESVAVMEYGTPGLLVYAASIIPQYIIYAMAVYVYYITFYAGKVKEKYTAIALIAVIVLVVGGTLTEAFVNPQILRFILKVIS